MKKEHTNYFEGAEDWFFDRYETAKVQANRWFVGFILSTALAIVSVIAVASLFPLKKPMPFVIHQNTTTGEVWVERPATDFVPVNDAQVQSDIIRYIVSYMSYTAADINYRFNLVRSLSSENVGKHYIEEQSNDNKLSPVNVLGMNGKRSVRIEDIVFIDRSGLHEKRPFAEPSHNLAKVDLVTTTIDHLGNKKFENWVATVGWVYNGLPATQQAAWDNWNGFMVTTFRVDPKNIEN
jgi:type IV secretion system protein VirB8